MDRLARQSYSCFLDGYSGYNRIAIQFDDEENTTFTCPFGTFAFIQMSFELYSPPMTFHRCMMPIFFNFLGESLKVFMDNFSIIGNDFDSCLAHLTKILEVYIKKKLVLNLEKSHFMIRERVVLRHLVSIKGLEVDKALIYRAFSGTSASTWDSYRTLLKSPSHWPPYFARTRTSSSTKKGIAHSRCWS